MYSQRLAFFLDLLTSLTMAPMKRGERLKPTLCITTQKSADIIHIATEASDHLSVASCTLNNKHTVQSLSFGTVDKEHDQRGR